ncbi:hypothetical protein [Aquimarina celericrescens]|uniref:Uncharacterized protein n=1 Tax=Aquimarina celericrescens TaxID=1964542 RepID=A0ABW5ATK7_9FLAO|nr:hypothetical protein [Aquimarina celericrescens]
MKWVVTLIYCFTIFITNGQSLKEQLWDFATTCNESLRQGYEMNHGFLPTSLNQYCTTCIDDAKNGYLFIEGTYPTCGCYCKSQVGAYKKANGNYVLVKNEFWSCDNNYGIYSTETIDSIMPAGFNLSNFNPSIQKDVLSYFYTEIKIPRIGTDTEITLKPFALGQVGTGNKGFSYNTKNSKIIYSDLFSIKHLIVETLQDESQLNLLMEKKINLLTQKNRQKVLQMIGEKKEFKSINELVERLQFIKKIYEHYVSLGYTKMILSWHREEGRFIIKSKSGKPGKLKFIDFLKTTPCFAYLC